MELATQEHNKTVAEAGLHKEFGNIRNYLAANAKGITRDEAMIEELVKVLFALSKTEQKNRVKTAPAAEAIRKAWAVINKSEGYKLDKDILFDDDNIDYVSNKLHPYTLLKSGRDTFGEAFEALIGPRLRGSQGQFFTPKNVVKSIIEILQPKPGSKIIDPACGSGGFISYTAQYLKNKNSGESKDVFLAGIDKDKFLSQLSGYQLALLGAKHEVICEDSLASERDWSLSKNSKIGIGTFDYVVTNPPFGAQIPINKEEILGGFDLGFQWKKDSKGNWSKTEKLMKNRPPQVLFIERCWQLLKEGGIAAIVLPEGIFGNVNEGYIREWLKERAEIFAIIDCPLETFMPSTSTKTCVLFFKKKKKPNPNSKVFIARPKNCGHDRRGKVTFDENGELLDDFVMLPESFHKCMK